MEEREKKDNNERRGSNTIRAKLIMSVTAENKWEVVLCFMERNRIANPMFYGRNRKKRIMKEEGAIPFVQN